MGPDEVKCGSAQCWVAANAASQLFDLSQRTGLLACSQVAAMAQPVVQLSNIVNFALLCQ